MSTAIDTIRESFEDFSSNIGDYRIDRNKLHGVHEIIFLTLCGLICGCEGWRDIERYGKTKIDFLRTFFEYRHGIPSDDTLRLFFRNINPKKFSTAFLEWTQTIDLKNNKHIAIDGKVSRHSFDGEDKPLHVVSAFASECRLVLAQEKVSEKSNEITAIPALLEVLDVEGSIVTIDAMGCQKEIAERIRNKNADYVLSLKGNQGTLHQATASLFQEEKILQKYKPDTIITVDGNEHGRIETRECRVIQAPKILLKDHDWDGLQTLVEVKSTREIKGVRSEERRYFLSSLPPKAEAISQAIRAHWSIENSLHWVLDVTFREDDSRIRKGNAPQNIAIMRHAALNMLQKTKQNRESIKQLRKAAGWDNTQLFRVLSNI